MQGVFGKSFPFPVLYIDRDSFEVSLWFSVTCKSHKIERVEVWCMSVCVCVCVCVCVYVCVLAPVCMYTGMHIDACEDVN